MADRFVLNNGEIRALLTGSSGPVYRSMASTANSVRNEAVRRCNVDKGGLRSSIIIVARQVAGVVVFAVGSRKEYAAAVHEGSRAHVIERRGPLRNAAGRVRTLRFPGRSGFVFVRRVWHPGYAGNPFLRDAMTAVVHR